MEGVGFMSCMNNVPLSYWDYNSSTGTQDTVNHLPCLDKRMDIIMHPTYYQDSLMNAIALSSGNTEMERTVSSLWLLWQVVGCKNFEY